MENIKTYEVSQRYIDYLSSYDPHLFLNKKTGQQKERKYIGVVLYINGFEYFALLSSYKEKHKYIKDSLDFLKIKNYAVIKLNCVFPVLNGECTYVDINKERYPKYRDLLMSEYCSIKSIQDKIRKIKLRNIV